MVGLPSSWDQGTAKRLSSSLRSTASERHVPMLSSVSSEPESLVVATDTGVGIHYVDWGGPAATQPAALPPIALLHGLAATAWDWAPVARRLAEHTRVFAIDTRGHGLSDSPRTGYDLESLAYDALTVLVANGYGTDAAGPPAVVAGHSFGAMVGAAMAAIQAGSIAGVGLIDFG